MWDESSVVALNTTFIGFINPLVLQIKYSEAPIAELMVLVCQSWKKTINFSIWLWFIGLSGTFSEIKCLSPLNGTFGYISEEFQKILPFLS